MQAAAIQEFLNFRDLGGLPTQDGLRLKPGKLFRSAAFDSLSADGIARLKSAGLGAVVDLRSKSEQERHPSALMASGFAAAIKVPEADPADAFRMLGSPDAQPEDIRKVMMQVYATAVRDFAQPFAEMLASTKGADHGLLIHCAIGKDRTGMAIALILAALNVSREVIMADYLATNDSREQILATLAQRFPNRQKIRPELVLPLLAADPAYLQAFWAQIDQEFGGEAGYFDQVLGFNAEARADLQARWLSEA